MGEQSAFGKRHADEVGDLGELRRRQCRGNGGDDVVGLIGPGVDGEDPARFEVDQYFVAGGGDPELHQRDARLADLAGIVAEDLDGHLGAELPRLAVAGPRRRQRCGDVRRSSRSPSADTSTHPIWLPVPTNDRAAARQATSTRSTRSPASIVRSRRSVRVTSSCGVGTR